MRQILVATDFSERSHRAVRRAVLLARETGARLLVVHVVDDDRDARIVEVDTAAARVALEGMKDGLFGGLACEARVTPGDPFDGIVRTARESAADLVVMGAHRRQLLRDIFVGTTIERVARSRVAPVLMVNTEATQPYQRALVGVDFSEHCAYAMRFLRESGLVSGGRVTLVHAFDAMAKGSLSYAGVESAKIEQYVGEVGAQARADLDKFLAKHVPGEASSLDVRVAQGHPAAVIPTVARSAQADLVVLATHGLSGLAKFLLGSITEALMRDLDRDVLAVPPRERG